MLMEGLRHRTVPLASERNFAVVFGFVFAIVAAYGYWQTWRPQLVVVFAALSVAVMLLGWLAPTVLRVPNRLWAKFGLLLSLVMTPLIMGIVFFVAVTPSGIAMRLFGIDPMKRRFDPAAQSYWIVREKQPGSMHQQS